MTNRQLLAELSIIEAEREVGAGGVSLDELERYAANSLSEAELSALEARAETEPEVALALEACAPLTDDVEDAIVGTLLSGAVTSPAVTSPAVAAKAVAVPAETRAASGFVTRRRPNSLRKFLSWLKTPSVGGPLAAAAAAATVLFVTVERGGALPGYTMEFSGGVAASRSANAPARAVPELAPGSQLTVNLRPSAATEEAVKGLAFVHDAGSFAPLSVSVKTSGSGAARFHGTLGEDFQLAPGTHDLVFVVSNRPGDPTTGELDAALEGDSRGFRAFRQTVSVVDSP